MTDREPHPRAHTHGDEYEKDLLDRVLTEVEGMRDEFVTELKGMRADLAAAFPKPPPPPEPDPDPEPSGPVEIAIEEPAPVKRTPAKKTTAAKRQSSKES